MRTPVQKRGIDTRAKLVEAARDEFCDEGYYQTSTNRIARRAGVSIGSLYAYFEDKEALFLAVLDAYHDEFEDAVAELAEETELPLADSREWMRRLIEALIGIHEETKALNREITILACHDDKIASIREQNRTETMRTAVGALFGTDGDRTGVKRCRIDAVEAVVFDLVDAVVDRVVFGNGEVDRALIVDVTADVACTYLENRGFLEASNTAQGESERAAG